MKMHPFQVILGFLGFVLVTSKEILWLRPWIGDASFNMIISALFSIHFLTLFTRYDREKAVLVVKPRLNWLRWPGINFLLALCGTFAIYFFFHELAVGDSFRSVKYGLYVLFLGSLLCESYDLDNLPKVFATLSVITSVVIVIQCLLVIFVLDNNLIGQPRLVSMRADGMYDFNDANPFWLGLIGDFSLVDYGFVQFRRANAYTSEPKYCSQVLLAGLVSLAVIRDLAAHKRKLAMGIIMIGLVISHAYSTLPVLLLAYLIKRLGRSRYAFIYSLLTILAVSGGVMLIATFAGAISGYARMRVMSFMSQADMLGEILSGTSDAFGRGVNDVSSNRVGLPPMPRFLIQFGWIGVSLWLVLLFSVLSRALKGIYLARSEATRWALALATSLALIFSFFFNSEPLSPLYSYLFAIVFHLTGNLQLAAAKARVPMRAYYGKLSPDFSF